MTEHPGALLLDVNVLVALAVDTHVHAVPARRWVAERCDEGWRCATTPVTESGLVRLLLNPHVFGTHLRGAAAVALLQQMKASPNWVFLADDSSLAESHIALGTLVGRGQVTDLHLVNLAARHGMRLATMDRGIRGFLEPDGHAHVELVPVV